ncbi:MAG: hypothetical protein WC464_07030 [Bdellovibrionales bacterium]
MFSFFTKHLNFGSKKISPKDGSALPFEIAQCLASKKPICVMHPENAPRMIHDSGFPKDFQLYDYAGATLEVLTSIGSNGKQIRRPALVAKMVRRYKAEDGGASVEMEMTASLRDLRTGKHPNAEAVAAALRIYYEEKVPIRERAIVPQKVSAVFKPAARFPVNDFFTRMNSMAQAK